MKPFENNDPFVSFWLKILQVVHLLIIIISFGHLRDFKLKYKCLNILCCVPWAAIMY
jgi:hypothetical protein